MICSQENVRLFGPILLAMSDMTSLLTEAEFLENAGFSVLEMTGSDEAISFLETRKDIRLLITDVKIRGCLDGIDLAHFAQKQRSDIGVILLGRPLRAVVGLNRTAFLDYPAERSILVTLALRVLKFGVIQNWKLP
jgi:hypothetical protein